ncbi:MAG TPA: hypothetical protein VN175_01215 [Rhizomicrobium sp.]|jgi:hypothetical protein|nr:hypothetical protein [Rhizomicrobium sp.]
MKVILMAALLAVAATNPVLAQGAPQGGGGGGGMAACREDAQKFCADKTGPDRRACMEANKDKLSDACKAARAARAQGGQ